MILKKSLRCFRGVPAGMVLVTFCPFFVVAVIVKSNTTTSADDLVLCMGLLDDVCFFLIISVYLVIKAIQVHK